MALCAEAFEKNEISIPILIGGAAVNKAYAESIATLENGKRYTGGVFFAKDAFEASRLLNTFVHDRSNIDKVVEHSEKAHMSVNVTEAGPIEPTEHIEPAFWGTSGILTWSAEALLQSINMERLFKGEWVRRSAKCFKF